MSKRSENIHAQIKKKIEAIIKKAEEGDVDNMLTIACIYSEGEFLPKDYIAAQGWLRKAEELGSDEAKKQLAKLLSEGNGVAQDLEEAFDIYHDLMMDCDLDAMSEVGFAYKYGRGVPQDDKKASYYINQAFDIELGLMEYEKRKMEYEKRK